TPTREGPDQRPLWQGRPCIGRHLPGYLRRQRPLLHLRRPNIAPLSRRCCTATAPPCPHITAPAMAQGGAAPGRRASRDLQSCRARDASRPKRPADRMHFMQIETAIRRMPSARSDAGALIRVDRAMAEMRRGSIVLIESYGTAALALAAETVVDDALR